MGPHLLGGGGGDILSSPPYETLALDYGLYIHSVCIANLTK